MAVRRSVRQITLIHPATGRELATLEPLFPSPVDELSLSPGGTRLVARTRTGLACVWDLRLIRRQLAAKGLDWNLPSYSPGESQLRVEVPAWAPDTP